MRKDVNMFTTIISRRRNIFTNIMFTRQKKSTALYVCVYLPLFCALGQLPALSWQHHPLFTRIFLETVPEVNTANLVYAEELEEFLISEESGIEDLLRSVETWARSNIKEYAPCPESLMFTADGNPETIKERFFHAIRINPETLTPLYILGFADAPPTGSDLLDVHQVCILSDTKEFEIFCFVKLSSGSPVSPVDVLASASNEPDYGMDTKLFEDNGSAFGKIYNFGAQPFGNPNLDYGSQAPFHMGFFHESPIVYLFGSFLKRSYVEYRIYLFKELSKFAFSTGHDYWGWRFMGWGLHYLADLSMPYHATALPGRSTLYMLLINLLDILGFPQLKNNAIQLCSNRHLAIESFMGSLFINLVKHGEDLYGITDGFLQGNGKSYLINHSSLQSEKILWGIFDKPCPLIEGQYPEYTDVIPRECLSRHSHDWSKRLDQLISSTIPDKYVNDPTVELDNLNERFDLVNQTLLYGNTSNLQEMVDVASASLFLFNYYGRGYIAEILK